MINNIETSFYFKGSYDLVRDSKYINRRIVTKCDKCCEGKQQGGMKSRLQRVWPGCIIKAEAQG